MVSGEQDTVFASKVKYKGIFNFPEYYKFCYNWLTEEIGLEVKEKEYSEKISGPVKDLLIKWDAEKKITDYFKFLIKVEFKILAMSEVEINKNGVKVKANKGEIGTKVKGVLVKDYDGKFETSGRRKIWRGIYEKWIISGRVKEFEDKLIARSDEFLGQAKAFLDIEGRKE